MGLQRATYGAPGYLDPERLLSRERDGALVLLPDTLGPVDGQLVAGFRLGTQALRVRAKREGVPVEVVIPEGARAGHYAEHAADWVLPLLLGVPVAAVGQLIANEVQRWIDEWRAEGRSRVPTLRYREVVVDAASKRTTVRELEGPADEVADWIARRSDPSSDPKDDEWQWPESE